MHIIRFIAFSCFLTLSMAFVSQSDQRISEKPNHFKKAIKKLDKLIENQEHSLREIKIANQSTEEYFFEISLGDKFYGNLVFSSTTVCAFGGCTDTSPQTSSKESDDIHFFVIIDSENKVQNITITDFESAYGYEVSSHSWLKQFFQRENDMYKLGREIDGITGATVSCNAMVSAINAIKITLK